MTAKVEGMKASDPPQEHFVCPGGISTIVKDFFRQAGVSVQFGNQLQAVNLSQDGKAWSVSTQAKAPLNC